MEQMTKWVDLSPREEDIVNELLDDHEHPSRELAEKAKMSVAQVVNTIRNIRRKHNEGKDAPYIYTCQLGYTLEEEPVWESKMRLQSGYGTLINGIPVFKMCKKLKLKEYQTLRLELKPQAMTIQQLLKGKGI